MRLNKYISECGVCSRREADRLIGEGRVRVNGAAAALGTAVQDGDRVTVDGKEIRPETEAIFLAVHKPRGVVVTTDRRWGDRTLEELVDCPKRVFAVGRLDKESEGLILMTNQGEAARRIQQAGQGHEKEYEVEIDRPVTEAFLREMAGGVRLEELDRTTAPCRVEKLGERSFRIVLTQGLNRQIRRMCAACGCRVLRLKRVRVMGVKLGNLPAGAYRNLTNEERRELLRELRLDTDLPDENPDRSKSQKHIAYTDRLNPTNNTRNISNTDNTNKTSHSQNIKKKIYPKQASETKDKADIGTGHTARRDRRGSSDAGRRAGQSDRTSRAGGRTRAGKTGKTGKTNHD